MARLTKRALNDVHKQDRGWGREHWIENIPEYCGKILVINPGKKGSLHFHVNKKETMLVNSGRMLLRLIDADTAQEYFLEFGPGDSVLIPQAQAHQIINPDQETELVLIEFSTIHEESDSRRLQKGD